MNKGDIRYDKQAIDEGLRKICEDISPNFLEFHSNNVFDGVKARSGLISQIMLNNPKKGKQWIESNSSVAVEPFDLFDREGAQKEYKEHISRALEEFPELSDNAAVLAWSDIPKLRDRMIDFLRNSRFEYNLKEAKDRYRTAYNLAYETTVSKWQNIVKTPPSNSPERDLKNFKDNALFRYANKLKTQSLEMPQKFKSGYQNLYQTEQKLLVKPLKEIENGILQRITERTGRPEFRHELVNMGGKTRFVRYNFGSRGDIATLKELDEEIFVWLDKDVEKVANAMMKKFKEHLDIHGVLEFLENVKDYSSTAKKHIALYEENIIQNLHQTYKNSCRGAFFCQLRDSNALREIVSTISDFAQPVDSKHSKEAEDEVIQAVCEIYEQIFKTIMKDLSRHLEDMFLYHVTLAIDNLDQLIEQMSMAFTLEVMDKESPLYQHFHSSDVSKIRQATKLTEHLKQLQKLSL